jgi:hypothetical protein
LPQGRRRSEGDRGFDDLTRSRLATPVDHKPQTLTPTRRDACALGPVSRVGMAHVPGMAPLRRAAASFANRVVVATMSSGARRCGNDVVGAGPAVSWSGLCGPASPCDHTFSVASMTSRRTGGVVAQLARSCLPGLRCHRPRTRRRSTHIRRFRHISVVDPRSAVDGWCWDTTEPPPSPDQPQ